MHGGEYPLSHTTRASGESGSKIDRHTRTLVRGHRTDCFEMAREKCIDRREIPLSEAKAGVRLRRAKHDDEVREGEECRGWDAGIARQQQQQHGKYTQKEADWGETVRKDDERSVEKRRHAEEKTARSGAAGLGKSSEGACAAYRAHTSAALRKCTSVPRVPEACVRRDQRCLLGGSLRGSRKRRGSGSRGPAERVC